MSQHEASSERIVKDPVARGRVVKGLGEIAFRVNDLDTIQAFYSEVISLNPM
ncbi:MAG: hypothetical protein AAF708_20270 [Deinococcota bacterium]